VTSRFDAWDPQSSVEGDGESPQGGLTKSCTTGGGESAVGSGDCVPFELGVVTVAGLCWAGFPSIGNVPPGASVGVISDMLQSL
jgi:hypothetical protein